MAALQPAILQALQAAQATTKSLDQTTESGEDDVQQNSISALDNVASLSDDEQAAAAEPTARPVYNFEYKVADNEAQTYISQSERVSPWRSRYINNNNNQFIKNVKTIVQYI